MIRAAAAPCAAPETAPLFAGFAPPAGPRPALREALTAAHRRPERELVAELLPAARLPLEMRERIAARAGDLVTRLRAKPRGSAVAALVQEYALSSQEGVALMCLAEALLRIPDTATRDALIRDKIGRGDWQAHLGGRSLFVNAATWGLVLTGRLAATADDERLSTALTRLVARCGEPLIRHAVDMAIGLMGAEFVMGRTIGEALHRAGKREAQGFSYSFDMLGEAAMTAADAERYFEAYGAAIEAIGKASAGRGIHAEPGISVKLSALHPRYARAQAGRVMAELLPRLASLALLARRYDIGLNIDAEEQDRLELSLDLLEALATHPGLAGWNGIGFVVQAYGKRCPAVLDFVIDLARRTGRRLMVRLVKGAYWDAEIKRAQVDGMADFPVFTRKVHTDLCYLACARKLLAARDAVFPQFATHNAQTLAAIFELAGPDFREGDYEFQCLHGMGEPLYEEVVGPLNRPCRIYAPVGTHETLLAYLVRRLLENGANSSFVHRLADDSVPLAELIADPAETVAAMGDPGAPSPAIAAPRDLYGTRANSWGLDLASDGGLAALGQTLASGRATPWRAGPADGGGPARAVFNPGDHRDGVGEVREAGADHVARAVARADGAAPGWAARTASERAAPLRAAADMLEAQMPLLLGLIMREAGKSAANAVAEVREAVDFLRYYADEATMRLTPDHRPLGPVACISPWNFPLAIFTGQVAAALAAGNPVLAKPAEETPLVAAEAVRLLHAAGIPQDVLQILPGDGSVGAALVAAHEVAGVLFTGSTDVARRIAGVLARRLSPTGRPVPLIAETGGQNAMIVDSSALPEQVVADVLASAFDSAGQRCSALRVLCLQEEVADPMLAMLKGAMAELEVGRTDRLSVDVGPVINPEAQAGIEAHIAAMAARGFRIHRLPLPAEAANGTFVAPTLIEISSMVDLTQEVFGPVLHVLRWRRADLCRLVDDINATGYGLTFGLHTRLDETIAAVTGRVEAGNLYVNRNMIGAVVGVQPFGGRGLSGTGPKAGGPLYLSRLVTGPAFALGAGTPDGAALAFADWLEGHGRKDDGLAVRALAEAVPLGLVLELPGPVGERNSWRLRPRGTLLLLATTETGLMRQIGMALATGNRAVVEAQAGLGARLADLPAAVAARLRGGGNDGPFAAALAEGEGAQLVAAAERLAALPGPIVPLHGATPDEVAASPFAFPVNLLLEEVSLSVNTAAAGGNASLLAVA
ncbi:bifunctional proline dehydrogenase/L-glutamate gamma-semialdehyde dehydrogenase PutA [Xanthobacter autotrophicus]|uniref:bifunctional proline dehydrogenase/L-glutamate gamma-semialdehyde dehydrogenase PutA n=1 Tax=Xanthobacter autotrophicus TaxID=280 RepID=UPI0024A6D436|nr:bifunctional proline dehydrogenase/L-glutamate gamma-semialdehyde dehydrogenase PutA [Xanthobacter autotrophicus]MDI4656474.1 bifunctional proline dehydrogenase/L-glutamate gamma-semialdehyde dehydrogenase PutA [Xanthobacter autotrophicus]